MLAGSSIGGKLAQPTSVLPKYCPDGNGRDLWRSREIAKPPLTGYIISKNRSADIVRQKNNVERRGKIPKFVPNGSGRDLYQQCNEDVLICHTGVTSFSEKPPALSRRGRGVSYQGKPAPMYIPDGSGRDLYFCAAERPLSPVSTLRRERVTKAPRCRTSPPPRFRATGTGRDTFQNPAFFDQSDTNRGGIIPKIQGFAYGDSSISLSNTLRQRIVQAKYRNLTRTAVCPSRQRSSIERLSSPTERQRLREYDS